MNFALKTTVAAAALTAFGSVASAGLIDFTDDLTGASGAIDGVKWTLTVVPGPLNQEETGPEGAAPTEALVGDNDGVGIINDEISFPGQFAQLDFTKDGEAFEMTLLTSYWLDLFIREDELSKEVAIVDAGVGGVVAYDAYQMDGENFGYGEFATLLTASTFLFYVGETNDGNSDPDAALAAVELAPVPLPAGVLLLGGALAGLGLARRRK